METTPLNKAIVTIADNPFWPKGDLIHIRDDQYAVIYRVSVRTTTREEEHLVVAALTFSISQAECEAVSRNLRETNARAIISFYIDNRDGWAQVITVLDEEFNLFNLAAAISVIKASCGWDESKPIVIMINNAEVRVWPRVDGKHWIAENRGDANCEGLS
jgi:hypothetical protein